MADVEAGGREVHGAPRVGAGDDRGAAAGRGPLDGGDLALADVAGQRRLQHGVGATGAAAQSVVVELDDVGDAVEHGAHRLVRPLHVAEVARVLHDHGRPVGRARTNGRRSSRVASHSWTSTTRAANARAVVGAEQVARSPSSPRRTRPS